MKRLLCALLVLVLPLTAALIPLQSERFYVGDLYVATQGVDASLFAPKIVTCDCCPPLWNGGVATVSDKLSEIEIEDMACVTLLGEYKLYLECVEIVPCIMINTHLISWHGLVLPYGDILIYSCGRAYRFTIL